MQTHRAHPGREGLTLIELMIALSILSLGLLGMLTMQTQALKGSQHGKQVSEAARVAEQQMEFLSRRPWAAIPPSAWSAPRVVVGPTNGSGPSAGQPYSVTWRVQAGPDPALRLLDVRVSWILPEAPAGSPGSMYAISSVRHNDP
jgi:prepilin-type N-terminal cleavage/methylation domain-containing protein